ncbi:MAG: YkgJ family cysteine cluster protein [Nitrospinota bacterium]
MASNKEIELCLKKCQGLCCTGISIPTHKPQTKKEIEELRFYILHKNIEIYVKSNRWYILVNEKCDNLGKDYLCKDYENRPLICRQFSSSSCEHWGDFFDIHLKNEEELMEYLDSDNGGGSGKKKKGK